MTMRMEIAIFLTYAAGMLLIYLCGRFLMVPLKWILKLLVNSFLGGVVLLIINGLGGNFGLFIPINPLTAVIAGILGLPGVIVMCLFFL